MARLDRVRSWVDSLERVCRRPGFVVVYAALALVLVLPAAHNSLQTEDRVHRAQGWTAHIYAHGSGDIHQNHQAKNVGTLPWIASEDLKISFFRPLASLSLSLDYQLVGPGSRWLYVQSFFWLALLIVAACTLFRTLNDTWGGAALASLLFALSDAHGLAVGWLAARHALMAAALSVVALVLFDRWRREKSRWDAWSCKLVFLLALLSSEYAVSALGFFLAHTAFIDRGPLRRRLGATVAYLAPLLIWLLFYTLGSYGTRGSGVYISPFDEPLEAARALVLRVPWLLTGTFGIGPADLGSWIPDADRAAWAAVAWLVAALVFALLVPALKRSRAGLFWAASLLLSTLPLFTSPPTDRLLLLPSLSGMALVDILVRALSARVGSPAWRATASLLAAGWLCVHGVLSPFLLGFSARALVGYSADVEAASNEVCAGATPGQHLVMVNAPSHYHGWLVTNLSRARGCPASHMRLLYGGIEPARMVRINAHTLLIRTEHGFVNGPLDRVFRGESRRFHLGQGLQLRGLQVVVMATTSRGMPKDVEFRFARPLEDAQWRFVAWDGKAYAPFDIPPIGAETRLPGFGAPPGATVDPE